MYFALTNNSPDFEWYYIVIFGFIREMFANTCFTQMFVTNVTVLSGDRGLTDITPYDVLETEMTIHSLASI